MCVLELNRKIYAEPQAIHGVVFCIWVAFTYSRIVFCINILHSWSSMVFSSLLQQQQHAFKAFAHDLSHSNATHIHTNTHLYIWTVIKFRIAIQLPKFWQTVVVLIATSCLCKYLLTPQICVWNANIVTYLIGLSPDLTI